MSCYQTPKQTSEISFNEISILCKKYKYNPTWIIGDFYLPDVNCETKSIIGSQYSMVLNELFLEALDMTLKHLKITHMTF